MEMLLDVKPEDLISRARLAVWEPSCGLEQAAWPAEPWE